MQDKESDQSTGMGEDQESPQYFNKNRHQITTNESISLLQRLPQKRYIVGAFLFFGILVAFNIIQGFIRDSMVIIHPGEQALITKFGKLQDDVLSDGMHIVEPKMTTVILFDMRIQRTDLESTARTKDLQRIKTNTTLNWQIDPAKLKEIYQQIGNKDDIVNKIITPSFDEILKASVPFRTLDKIFSERQKLKEEVTFKIKARLAPYGIIVNDVSLVNLTASDEFTKATEDRQIAKQQAITDQIVAEQKFKEAKLNALQAKAEAEAVVNKAQGEAQAQKLLQQNLTPALLQKQAIDKWDGSYPMVMGSSSLPLINLNVPAKPEAKP